MAAAATAQIREITARPAGWARQGLETLAAAVKIVSDLTAQELALGIGMIRERATTRPAPGLAELAGRTITAIIDAEKLMLDLAAGESTLIADGLKEGVPLRPSAAAIVDLVPRGIEAFAEVQSHFLDTAVEEIHGLVESYTDGKPLMAGTRLANLTRTELECFIDIQKKLLDQFAEQVTIATGNSKPAPKAAAPDRPNIAIHVTRDALDKLIEAQKKLLHMAIAQFEAGLPKERPQKVTSFAELTQKSVKNITTAQKSLLDLAAKPLRAAASAEPAAPRAPRRPRRKK